MLKDDRTVIERLDDIENKIPTFEHQEPRPISEVIGRPFADYLNDATVYGYEDDVRKFKRTIKKQRTMPIVWLSILIPVLVFDVVSLIINKQLEWLLVIATTLTLICPVLALITLSKQKNKQPMHSFWNVKNTELYLANEGNHKKIVKEESNGAIFIIMLVFKIVSIIASFGGVFWYFFASMQTTANSALYWVGSILGYITVLSNAISIRIGKPYYYFNYIIETEDSYVTYPNLDYFKK